METLPAGGMKTVTQRAILRARETMLRAGLNPTVFNPYDEKEIVIRSRVLLEQGDMLLQRPENKKYGIEGNESPENFWQSVPGLIEAKGRVDHFVYTHLRMPNEAELSGTLIGLQEFSQYFLSERQIPIKIMFQALGYEPQSQTDAESSKAFLLKSRLRTVDSTLSFIFEDVRRDAPQVQAKPAVPEQKTEESKIQEMSKEEKITTAKEILEKAGIDTGLIGIFEMSKLANLWHTQNFVGGAPVVSEEHRRYGFGTTATKPFWTSVSGMIEAKRRVDEFFEEHGRLPTSKEMQSPVKVWSFYTYHRDAFNRNIDRVYGLLGYEKPQRQPEEGQKAQQQLDRKSEKPKAAAAKETSEVQPASLKRNRNVTRTLVEDIPVIHNYPMQIIAQFGRTVRTPTDFSWLSREGGIETKRRINEFIEQNNMLPNNNDLELMGLKGCIEEFSKANSGRRDIVGALGYRKKKAN